MTVRTFLPSARRSEATRSRYSFALRATSSRIIPSARRADSGTTGMGTKTACRRRISESVPLAISSACQMARSASAEPSRGDQDLAVHGGSPLFRWMLHPG